MNNYVHIKALFEFLEEETKVSGKVSFRLLDGSSFQGWIDCIDSKKVFAWSSDPMATDDLIIMEIEQIEVNSLSYFEDFSKQWKEYKVKY